MSDPVYNFSTCVQGANWTANLYLKDDNGAAKVLTGYTARMQIRDKKGGQIYATLDTSTGEIVIIEATGKITPSLTAAQTAVITKEVCEYDLFLTNGSGTKDCLIYGDFKTRQRVTV